MKSIFGICFLFFIISSCARSTAWTPQDSLDTAAWLQMDILQAAWLDAHIQGLKKKPVIRFGDIHVQSIGQVINADLFTNEIRNALVNAPKVRVRGGPNSGDIHKILIYQDHYVADGTRHEFAEELGADYLITGSINTQSLDEGGRKEILYAVDLVLRNIQNQEIVWTGRHLIRK